MHFSGIKIAAYDPLNIDPHYLHFKNIEMEDCEFVSTPKTISHWLGHDISVLKSSDDRKSLIPRPSLLFQVKEEADYGCSRIENIDSDDST